MLLTADVGNTEIVLGVFDGPELEHTWRLSTRPERTSDELALQLAGFLEHRDLDLRSDLSGLCIASVVPDVTSAFREMAERYLKFAPVIVGPGTRTGVPVLTDNPREVGADRVVNTLAAFTMVGGPSVVVDFGTSTNFDVVSAKGEFLGGVIAPGLQISAAALVGRTARLTRVDLQAPRSPVGKSTVEAIHQGIRDILATPDEDYSRKVHALREMRFSHELWDDCSYQRLFERLGVGVDVSELRFDIGIWQFAARR